MSEQNRSIELAKDMDNEDFRQGIAKAAQKDYKGAIDLFSRSLQADPYSAEIYYRRGLAYFDAGDIHNAISDYTRSIDLFSDGFEAHYARALARLGLKNLPGALADVDRAIMLNEKSASAYELRGILHRKQGKIDLALIDFKQAANLFLEKKDAESCRRCLEKVEQIKPKAPPPVETRSTLSPVTKTNPKGFYTALLDRAENGDLYGAMKEVEWALQLDDRDADAYCCRGLLRCKRGDDRGAISDFNQVLKLDADNATAYRNRGKLRSKMGDFGGAISDFNKALNANEDDALLLEARGKTYLDMGEYQKAVDDLTRALKIDPDRPTALLDRGLAFARLEEMQRAREDYQRAATKYCERGDWDNYQNALDRLKKLQAAPAPTERSSSENPLKQRLLMLVGGHWELAERLIEQAKYFYPGMPEDWYIEKIVYDLERDRDL